MPFLKFKRMPRSKILDDISKKNNLHHVVFTSNQKSFYIGDWKNNFKNGKGRSESKNHIMYEGDWKDGLRHGFGILSKMEPDGTIILLYEGGWAYGKYHGFGRLNLANGKYYEGEMKNGLIFGNGQMWFNNGQFYDGQWKNNLFCGFGILIYKNGNRYEGEWKEGLKHGRGLFYHIHSGQLQSGIWKNDYSICSTIEDAAFRACSLQATKYPILNMELEDWLNVYTEQEQVVLKDLGKTEEADKRGKEPIYECHLPLADWFYQECCVQTKMANKYKFHQQLLCD